MESATNDKFILEPIPLTAAPAGSSANNDKEHNSCIQKSYNIISARSPAANKKGRQDQGVPIICASEAMTCYGPALDGARETRDAGLVGQKGSECSAGTLTQN